MRTIFAVLCSSLLLACQTNSPVSPQIVKSGQYVGNLILTQYIGSDSAMTTTGQIVFTFTDSGWYSYQGYTPTGGGTFALKSDSIVLIDRVAHLAIFDWTLILGGAFYFRVRTDSLIMIQEDKPFRRHRYINLAVPVGQSVP